MIIYHGIKLTANQCAKAIIADKGIIGVDFWGEAIDPEQDKLTERERAAIQERLETNYDRIVKFLGIDSCGNIQK